MSEHAEHSPSGPSLKWLVPLLGGLLCGAYLFVSGWVDLRHPFNMERGVLHPFFIVVFALTVAVFGVGLVQAVRWVRLHGLYRQYPLEPWRWEFAQGPELVDAQLPTVTRNLLVLAFIGCFMLVFHAGIVSVSLDEETPTAVPILFGGMLLIMDVMLYRKAVAPTFAQLFALMRFGRTRLRLPQVPLWPGASHSVEVFIPRGRSQLRTVRGVLRRVRERRVTRGSGKNKSTETVRDLEYSQPLRVEAAEQGGADTLVFEVPVPELKPQHSTDLGKQYRCLWEVELTSEVSGPDFQVTFVVPVYWVPEERLSA